MSDDGSGDPCVAERALVVGDLNPDLIVQGDVVPGFGQLKQLLDSSDLVIGGSAGITAHGLARLGRPVSLVAAIGPDTFGTEITSELTDVGVDTSTLVLPAGSADRPVHHPLDRQRPRDPDAARGDPGSRRR